MAEIESLEIKIKANAQSASKSIDALTGKLRYLSQTLSSVSGNKLTSLSNGVNSLASSMQAMKSVGTADFTRLTKNLQKLGSIDANAMNSASGSIRRLSNSMQSLTTVDFKDTATQLTNLSSSINRLGYKTADKAIQNMPLLAQGLRDMMSTLSTAPKVSQNLIDMTNALAKLSRTGAANIAAAAKVSKGFNSIHLSARKASGSVKSLAYYFGKLYANFWLLFRIAGKVKQAIDISSDLTETQNVVDVTFGKMAYKVEELASTSIKALGMSELTVKKIASRYQAMGNAMGIQESAVKRANTFLESNRVKYDKLGGSMADVSVNLTKLAADMASFYNVSQESVAEDLESVFTGSTRPLRQYGLDLTEATLSEWAMRNGLDANIKTMSQAQKTLLRYQYVLANTKDAQGDFARTSNTWANQVRILQENFKALGTTIGRVMIQALKPFVQALNQIMIAVNQFAVMVSNALGKIFGWKFDDGGSGVKTDLEDGASAAEDMSDGIGDAAKNAKKLKQQLQGLDELNVLNSDSDSGSGSGSSGVLGGLGSGASDVTSQWKKDESIFESGIDNLYDLGKAISEKLTDAMNSINWNAIYEKARNFGTGLAQFLNGLISPELFASLGKTIANSLNTVLVGLNSFATEFDWKDFGNSLATGLNTFFTKFQFSTLTRTIANWFNGLITASLEFVTTFDFENLGANIARGINEFFTDFKFGELATTISKAIKGVFTTASTILKKTDFEKIGEKIGEFLENLEWPTIFAKAGEVAVEAIGAAIKLGFGVFESAPLETALIAAFGLMKFTGLGSTVAGLIKNELGTNLAKALGDTWVKDMGIGTLFKNALFNDFQSMGIATSLKGFLTADLGTLISEGSVLTSAASLGAAIAGGLVAAFAGFEVGKKIGGVIAEAFGDDLGAEAYKTFSWKEFFGAFNINDAKGAFSEWEKSMEKALGNVVLTMKANLDVSKEVVSGWISNIKQWWGEYVSLPISLAITDVKTFISNIINSIKQAWNNFKLEIGIKLPNLNPTEWWNQIKTTWNNYKADKSLDVNAKAGGTDKTVSGIWNTVKAAWDKKTKNKTLSVKTSGSKIKESTNNIWSSVTKAWGNKTLEAEVKAKNPDIQVNAEIIGFKIPKEYAGRNGMPSYVPVKASGGIYKNGKWQSVQQYAAGGLPNTGQMFVAREAGPELVGTIGSSTAVLNNDQIVASVSEGVAKAVASVMGGQNVNVVLQGDAQNLFRVVQQKSNEYMRRTGNPAFAF